MKISKTEISPSSWKTQPKRTRMNLKARKMQLFFWTRDGWVTNPTNLCHSKRIPKMVRLTQMTMKLRWFEADILARRECQEWACGHLGDWFSCLCCSLWISKLNIVSIFRSSVSTESSLGDEELDLPPMCGLMILKIIIVNILLSLGDQISDFLQVSSDNRLGMV